MSVSGKLIVSGAKPLCGAVRVPAAKNSVLPLLAAALLCEGEVRLRAVPRLSDVECCLALLRTVGGTADWRGSDIVVHTVPFRSTLPAEAAQMRASVLFCAPLLAKLGRAEAPLPGGCRIGARPIDLHLAGLAQMGAHQLETDTERLVLIAPSGLHGTDFTLRFPSVGATETLLLAAVCARGETIIRGAAREPEIVDLANFLNLCGGCVQGAGSPVIRIEGRRSLHGCTFSPLPDRIFASTIACAAAAAGGRAEILGCAPALYAPVLDLLEQAGCAVKRGAHEAAVSRFGKLRGVGHVFTGVYPGLATDAAPLLAAALLCAGDATSLTDVVFERRFACAEGFRKMGANARVEGRTLHLSPCKALHAAEVCAPDLRGGAALVIAALAAQGESCIDQTEYIARGYACLASDLSGLGAQIYIESQPRAHRMKKLPAKKQNHLAIGAKR